MAKNSSPSTTGIHPPSLGSVDYSGTSWWSWSPLRHLERKQLSKAERSVSRSRQSSDTRQLTPVPVNLNAGFSTSPSTMETFSPPPFANRPVGLTRSTSTSRPGTANLRTHPFPSSRPISPTLNFPEFPLAASRPEGTGIEIFVRPAGISRVTFSARPDVEEVTRYVTRSGALPLASSWRSTESPEQANNFERRGPIMSTLASGWTVCSMGGLSSCCRE